MTVDGVHFNHFGLDYSSALCPPTARVCTIIHLVFPPRSDKETKTRDRRNRVISAIPRPHPQGLHSVVCVHVVLGATATYTSDSACKYLCRLFAVLLFLRSRKPRTRRVSLRRSTASIFSRRPVARALHSLRPRRSIGNHNTVCLARRCYRCPHMLTC